MQNVPVLYVTIFTFKLFFSTYLKKIWEVKWKLVSKQVCTCKWLKTNLISVVVCVEWTCSMGSVKEQQQWTKSSSSSVISHFLCLYLTTISRHTMITTTVTMIKPVERTPTTTGTLTRGAVWKRKCKLMFAHTVRHVAHTRLLRSCGGRDTGWPDTHRWMTTNRIWSWRGRQFILINRHKNTYDTGQCGEHHKWNGKTCSKL